jgi:adenosine deaminase
MTRDRVFYQSTIDALSMRNFVPGHGTGELSGHDHTFATFPRFGAVAAAHLDDMLLVTHESAYRNNVLYVEQIADPSAAFSPALLGADAAFSESDFDRDLTALAPILPDLVAGSGKAFDAYRRKDDCSAVVVLPSCGTVTRRFLFFVLRTLPPRQVFAQMALGFALAANDPLFVGVNFVAPEDDAVALRDFGLHMQMFQFFHKRYPQVKLSLHAGELSLGLVPPAELGFHIRQTVEIAGASRIGHGYEIPYENGAPSLLAEMAQKKIAVEINLTSNAITHGLEGAGHPLSLYRAAHVPVVLSADDEGVFRIDLTHEYMRAITEQHFTYQDLKEISRNGLEYSFLPGASLWQNGDYHRRVAVCATHTPACGAFLNANEKAALQMDLETQIAAYEDSVLAGSDARR